MLTEPEKKAVETIKEIGKLLPAADAQQGDTTDLQKLELRTAIARLALQMKELCKEDEPISTEFFNALVKNVHPLMREIFIFGGLVLLGQSVENA